MRFVYFIYLVGKVEIGKEKYVILHMGLFPRLVISETRFGDQECRAE